jgi:hypothetical protein
MTDIRALCTFWRPKETKELPTEPFLTAKLTFIPREGEYISVASDSMDRRTMYKVVRIEHNLDSDDRYPQACSVYVIPATEFSSF